MSDKYKISVPYDWKERIDDSLTDDFIRYQYALDFPVNAHLKSFDEKVFHYNTDYIFRDKVRFLVGQVISRVNESIG